MLHMCFVIDFNVQLEYDLLFHRLRTGEDERMASYIDLREQNIIVLFRKNPQ